MPLEKREGPELIIDSTAEVSSTVKDKGQFDIATSYLEQFASVHGDYTESEGKRVLRKIDMRITPLMWVTTILAAVDVSIPSEKSRAGSNIP